MNSKDLDSVPEGYIDEHSDIGFEEFLIRSEVLTNLEILQSATI